MTAKLLKCSLQEKLKIQESKYRKKITVLTAEEKHLVMELLFINEFLLNK